MKTPILQFGTSRFLQAHADLFISEALASGEALGPITVVQTTRSGERSRRLTALASPEGFPVRIRGKKSGEIIDKTIVVTSVRRALSIHDDWDETARIFTHEVELVICNTADRGYDISEESDTYPENVPASFPGKLVKLLHIRFVENGAPITILPTELIARNGDVLRQIAMDLATRWALPEEFMSWLANDVTFLTTLVDRIVSEALEPAGAIAEPYALWAIEAQPGQLLPCTHPDIVAAPDISSYANLKLYILNLGHTALTDKWLKSDLPRTLLVKELLAMPEYRDWLVDLYRNDVLPGFILKGMGDEAERYIAQTLERFENPFLDHKLADIAQNHEEKLQRRIGGFLTWSGISSPKLEALLRDAT